MSLNNFWKNKVLGRQRRVRVSHLAIVEEGPSSSVHWHNDPFKLLDEYGLAMRKNPRMIPIPKALPTQFNWVPDPWLEDKEKKPK